MKKPTASVDDVELVAHDPAWAEQFRHAEDDLRELLGDVPRRIEHVGSTAIPGLVAKPIIDVVVEVPSDDVARTTAAPALMAAGYYECYRRFDEPPGHFQCVKRDMESFKRLIHVHLLPVGHPMWESVAFRDYLRAHADDRDAYAALKSTLARRFSRDREAYTAAKSEFVQEMTKKALRLGPE